MKIHVWLNEREITREIAADLPLLEFVRSEGCYSVKRGCETSNCGLCTVWIDHKPVLSCSVLAARADGTHITTLEGVEDRAKEFGTYLAKQGGEQCGFCNPGFIMNVLAMEDELENPTVRLHTGLRRDMTRHLIKGSRSRPQLSLSRSV